MTEKTWGILIIGIIGALLTLARRFKNTDETSGSAIAGWTLFILILWLFGVFE